MYNKLHCGKLGGAYAGAAVYIAVYIKEEFCHVERFPKFRSHLPAGADRVRSGRVACAPCGGGRPAGYGPGGGILRHLGHGVRRRAFGGPERAAGGPGEGRRVRVPVRRQERQRPHLLADFHAREREQGAVRRRGHPREHAPERRLGYAPLYSILNGKDIAAVTSTISSLVGATSTTALWRTHRRSGRSPRCTGI